MLATGERIDETPAVRFGLYLTDAAAKLHRRLDAESDDNLARGMHYPYRWDPFFEDYMTLADVYRFPTQHFNFHRQQPTLASGT